ncbi:MAG: alpha/beta hydrolase [Ruminococcaceae bacterium]|nr:alpha/beta hydrolase [Oscillospiraceae bacterium]
METGIIIILAVLILFFLILLYIYNTAFYNSKGKEKRRKPFHTPAYDAVSEEIKDIYNNLINAKYEDVYTESKDKLSLHARYYHNTDGAPVAIMAHGYRSNSTHDSGGAYRMFTERGYNVLIPDQRTHGKSEGHTISFGVKERYDILKWIEYITNRFGDDTAIVLMGVSMGAATVMMCSDLDLKADVKGIIADCGYTSPKDIISRVMKEKMNLPPKLFYPLVKLSARIFGGFDPDESSPVSSVKNSKYPILFIHGDADSFVPYYMSEKLYEECTSKKTFLGVHGADHGISFIIGQKEYFDAVDKFLLEIGAK